MGSKCSFVLSGIVLSIKWNSVLSSVGLHSAMIEDGHEKGYREGSRQRTWKSEFSVEEPMPKLSILVLPTMIAPAARSLATAVASYDGTWPSRILEPAVVCTPLVQRLSCRSAHKWVSDAEPSASNRTELAKRVMWIPHSPFH